MARIPIEIYKVPINLTNYEIKNQLFQLKNISSNYLIGIDENYIYKKGKSLYIRISPTNLPNEDILDPAYTVDPESLSYTEFEVEVDENNEYYILINNQKYYIKRNRPSAEEQLVKVFEFHVNPTRVTPTYRKLFNEIRTRGGWEIQHWGNTLTELHIEGITGSMLYRTELKTTDNMLSKQESIVNSYAWKKVQELRRIYEQDHQERNKQPTSLLGMTYYDSFVVGFFTEFTGPVSDAEKPYLMTFSFTFKVQESIYGIQNI